MPTSNDIATLFAETVTNVVPVAAPTETPAFNAADTSKSNVAAPKRTRKLSGKAVAATKAEKPAKPVAAKADSKPTFDPANFGRAAYNGASPPVRVHAHKLSPIVLGRIPNSYTDRDSALLKLLYSVHGTKPFARLTQATGNLDAGAVSRLIGHGYVNHVSGNLDQSDCKFAVTAKAVKARFAKA